VTIKEGRCSSDYGKSYPVEALPPAGQAIVDAGGFIRTPHSGSRGADHLAGTARWRRFFVEAAAADGLPAASWRAVHSCWGCAAQPYGPPTRYDEAPERT